MKPKKTLAKILSGSKSIRFDDMCLLLKAFGFVLDRVNGSHHIFINSDVTELINLQAVKGEAKPYQVRQIVKIVEKYNLKLENEA